MKIGKDRQKEEGDKKVTENTVGDKRKEESKKKNITTWNWRKVKSKNEEKVKIGKRTKENNAGKS